MVSHSAARVVSYCALALLAGFSTAPFTARAQADEFRAFWCDAFGPGFKNAAEVTTFINDIRAAKANAIVPEIRKRGDAYYNGSIYEPKPTDISPASFDPLADLIAKAHDTSSGKQRI